MTADLPLRANASADEPDSRAAPAPDPLSLAMSLGAALAVGSGFLVRAQLWRVALVAGLVLAGLAGLRRRSEAASLALGAGATLAVLFVPAIAGLAPLPIVVGLVVVVLAAGGRMPWLRRGELSATIAAWIAAIALASGCALLAWWTLLRPDVSDLTLISNLRSAVAQPAFLAALLILWSALNAAAEEFFFRGVLQRALEPSLGSGWAAVVQALSFGMIHYRGFPRGWSGVLLATVYGLMLGMLRRRTNGLLAPWIAHVAADLVVVGILLAVMA